tara:strand:- start:98 stop:484 length:387 start_codon:yes stop_codon:yes gene_type:complete
MLNKLTNNKQGESMINHPNNSIEDMINISVIREANKKTFKKQKLAKNCYKFINQFINNEINKKAKLQPIDGFFYKNLDYQQNIEFKDTANLDDVEKFVNWIKKFTVNKVKTETYYDINNNLNLKIYYK